MTWKEMTEPVLLDQEAQDTAPAKYDLLYLTDEDVLGRQDGAIVKRRWPGLGQAVETRTPN